MATNNESNTLQKYAIRELDTSLDYVVMVALLIAKQEPHVFKSTGSTSEDRAVWNITVRDSPSDYINVSYWGAPEKVNELHTVSQIGSLLEIVKPRVMLRSIDDRGEPFRPTVTSPFQLVVSEGSGSITNVHETVNDLKRLLHLPTKPMFNYTSLANVFSNIHSISGNCVDLLVAVRQIGEDRFVNTKNGMKQVRNVIVFDNTNPGMAISFWNQEYIARASLWKPRETILFITDCRVTYDSYSNNPKGSPSMKSIITVDPEGKEARDLSRYAQSAVLHSSTVLDQMVGGMPEASSIKNVMNIGDIQTKIRQISVSTSTRIEDLQFATIVYAYIIDFDIDGVRRIFTTRCSLCKGLVLEDERCKNPICLSNTSNEVMIIEKTFDFRIQISDRTGNLNTCRLNGKNAEVTLGCTPQEFSLKTDAQVASLKWRFLMELCKLRLVILCKNKRTFITVLTCEKADVGKLHSIM